MYKDIEFWLKTTSKHVSQTQQSLPNTRSKSSWVKGVSVDLDKKYGIARARTNPNGAWDSIARKMTQKFEEASHPFFCSERFLKEDLKSLKGKYTIHFHGTTQTKTMFDRTILACNQLRRSESFTTKQLVIVKDRNCPHATSRT